MKHFFYEEQSSSKDIRGCLKTAFRALDTKHLPHDMADALDRLQECGGAGTTSGEDVSDR